MEGVLAAHDMTRCEVHLYSDVRQPDATTARLVANVDGYHPTWQLSHAELATLCRSHGVDVLIDLQGHMQPNRLPALALGAADVVLTYLGYPGSTGIPWLAGRLTDGWADPEDDPQQIGPELPLRIAGGYLAYTPPPDAPAPASPPSAGGFTFGSFNDALKLNDEVLATWAELLSRCDARLLLKTRALAWPAVRERVLSAFSARGVDPARIELCAATAGRREHLELYARVDVALDTFPYAGATTTCEALYMGVPVVTLAGDRHAARMGVFALPLTVGAARLRVEKRAGVAAIRSTRADQLQQVQLAAWSGDQLRQQLKPARALEVHLLTQPARSYATTPARQRERAANTPWYSTRFLCGLGMSATSLARKSRGS